MTTTSTSPAASASFDAVLERLLSYGPEFGGGLSNHGPMAAEALISLGADELLEPFVDDYVPRLEAADAADGEHAPFAEGADWEPALAEAVEPLLPLVGGQAGHGVLRVAHATRSLKRADTEVRRRELSAALGYLGTATGLAGPARLRGDREVGEVVASLPRLSEDERGEGSVSRNLRTASQSVAFIKAMASVAPVPFEELPDRFDTLALVAGRAMIDNVDNFLDGFSLLHGVTVTTMSRQLAEVLLAHGSHVALQQLEASVVGFTLAAVMGFDMAEAAATDWPEPAPARSTDESIEQLAVRVASVLDDHNIKLADACVGLARRRPDAEPNIRAILQARLGVAPG